MVIINTDNVEMDIKIEFSPLNLSITLKKIISRQQMSYVAKNIHLYWMIKVRFTPLDMEAKTEACS